MPKEKFSLSKKHEYLIDKLGEIPDPEELSHRLFSADTLQGTCSDHRGNTEEILLSIIETLTKGTQQEETEEKLYRKQEQYSITSMKKKAVNLIKNRLF